MEERYEEELNLSALLLGVCLKWRVLLLVAALCAVAAGGARLTMNLRSIRDPEAVGRAKERYEGALAGYEAEGKALEMQLTENRRNLALQADYNHKSMLMKVDAHSEWNGAMNFYIDTGYQIMPGSTYQDENPAYKIICAYYDYYNSGEFYTLVMERLSFDMVELKYLKEILGVTFDTSRYAITINVVADTREHCEELVRVAGDVFQARYAFVGSSLGEHMLKKSDIVVYALVNTDRESYQAARKNQENAWLQSIPEINEQYREWEERRNAIEAPIVDMGGAVKSGMKWMILAAAAGLFLCATGFFLTDILSGRIRDASELCRGRVLAELPARGKRKNKIDRLICRMFGVTVREAEYDSRMEAVALSLGRMLCAESCGKGTVAFVGDVGDAELDGLVKQASKVLPGEYRVVAAGNMIVDPAAAARALEADAVVLVVRRNVSLRRTYAQFCERLKDCRVKLLGTILIGVEGI